MSPAPDRHVLFRADGGPQIGTGHIVRCRTLGAELQRRGWMASLASRELPPDLARSVRGSGMELISLDAAADDEAEHAVIADHVAGPVTFAVVDHYGIGADWQRPARAWAERMMAIDDLADRFQEVDLLLNQNPGPGPSRYDGLVPPTARILHGPTYALVRPEFAAIRMRAERVRHTGAPGHRGRVERILVFMSGTDPDDVTGRAARAAIAVGVPVDVVVGAAYPFLASLRAWASDQPLIQLHVDTLEMATLMERADISIGAAGSATWERCTLGLPTVLVTLADNQVETARHLADIGAAVDLGWQSAVTTVALEDTLIGLARDPARLVAMSEAAARVTDGQGTIRVADELQRLVTGAQPRSDAARPDGRR
jgi:UDP-2,4-diacetamido-2,4,6-trideoxy-beta-L-altropyranose hydrolase